MLFVACLLLSPITLATTLYSTDSCYDVVGERELLECYDDNQRIIPLEDSRLPEDQELIDSFRCGTRLLQTDMTMNEASKVCRYGLQPSQKEHYLQSFEIHHQGYYGFHYISVKTYKMERWTFKQYGRFRTYVIFRDGVIYQIIQDRSKRN